MVSETQKIEIINALAVLPPEKVAAARDFILFLQKQYGQTRRIDESDEWTDKDLRDFTAASRFAEKT